MRNKFIEGEVYNFKYIKTIFLEEEFFVFEDSNKEKHLLSVFYYANYGFKQNEYVKVKILRIDCSGKIFFEPEHSYYKIGKIYKFNFKVIELKKIDNPLEKKRKLKREKIFTITVTDIYGNEHSVTPHKWQQRKNYKTDWLKCRIDKIMKGNFILTNMEKDSSLKDQILGLLKNKK